MNKALEQEVKGLQGGMIYQAERNGIPEFIEVRDGSRSSSKIIVNKQNGKEFEVGLYAYGDVLKALKTLF